MPPVSAKAYDDKTQNPLPQKDIIKPWAGYKTKRGADETAQWLVPSTHGGQLTNTCNSSSRGSNIFWLPQAPALTYTNLLLDTQTYIIKKNKQTKIEYPMSCLLPEYQEIADG